MQVLSIQGKAPKRSHDRLRFLGRLRHSHVPSKMEASTLSRSASSAACIQPAVALVAAGLGPMNTIVS